MSMSKSQRRDLIRKMIKVEQTCISLGFSYGEPYDAKSLDCLLDNDLRDLAIEVSRFGAKCSFNLSCEPEPDESILLSIQKINEALRHLKQKMK